MREAQEVIDFARAKGNAMAYFKAVQHRADLSGLLVQKIQLETVDLRGSLEQARLRVITAISVVPDIGAYRLTNGSLAAGASDKNE